jgi:glycosyltransferase involved in cell wall biosynthesis
MTLDVIIPSYRLQSKYLLPILQMDIPPEANVRFLIVADNPKAEIPREIETCIDNKKALLIRNPENFGVCKTRNIGIDTTTGDWILFLDDDVTPSKTLLNVYVQAIKENPNNVGFFGDVVFPPSINSFTRGIRTSGILNLFSVSEKMRTRRWTPTANVLVKRSEIGSIRFEESYPKNGSIEDVDFFLRLYRNTHRELQCLSNATVYHDWWLAGKRSYIRFIRWNSAIAELPDIFPEYAYYTFPNMLESLLLGLPLTLLISLFLHSFLPVFCVLIGIITGEGFTEFLHLLRSKGLSQCRFVIEVVLIRAANDLGRLTKLAKIPTGICRRFNLTFEKKNITSQRLWAGLKFTTYLLFSVGLYTIVRLLAN